MVQIVLIRPGTSEFGAQGRIEGNLDIPLCEQGKREVQQAIGELKPLGISLIYSCPCEAAWQTASTIAAGLDIKAKKLETLMNLDHGLWQGMLLDDVKRKQPKVYRQWQEHPEMVCPPEGEMLNDCRERVEATITKLQKKHRDDSIGLVLPEPLASIVHQMITGGESIEAWKADTQGAAWEALGQNLRSVQVRGTQPTPQRGSESSTNRSNAAAPGANGNGHSNGIVTKNRLNSGSISAPVSLESGA